MTDLSLYIHIPFCVRKCNYCDFLSAPCDEETKQKYVDALCREIEQRSIEFQDRNVDTIFLGGGTPSMLSVKQMERIVLTIRKEFRVLADAEISMEMNPGTVDREKLETYHTLGINRLSIGLQSANNEELKILGRIHTWEAFLQTWKLVRETGFSNVNIDLMSALPGQTLESYEETVRKVLALQPEHISAYSLIVEEGTLFYEWFGDQEKEVEMKKKLPDENTERQMYELTKQWLEEQGYFRYEISNYALKGYECKHNVGYWTAKEYLGLGLGAASLIEKVRYRNISDLPTYLMVGNKQGRMNETSSYGLSEKEGRGANRDWIEEKIPLTVNDQMEEFMFLGLRLMEGVSPVAFKERFGQTLQQVYGKKIEKLQKQGLLMIHEETGNYALTLKGMDVSNQVFVEFLF